MISLYGALIVIVAAYCTGIAASKLAGWIASKRRMVEVAAAELAVREAAWRVVEFAARGRLHGPTPKNVDFSLVGIDFFEVPLGNLSSDHAWRIRLFNCGTRFNFTGESLPRCASALVDFLCDHPAILKRLVDRLDEPILSVVTEDTAALNAVFEAKNLDRNQE